MTEWLRFVLVLSGLTYLLTQSAIFAPVRRAVGSGPLLLAVFVYCPACVGFWMGAGLGLLGYWPAGSTGWLVAEAAVSSCGLMALWGRLMPSEALWDLEQGWRQHDETKEEASNDDEG